MSILSFLWVWSLLINSMVNSVNMLYMVLSHTGSLYWSTGRLVHQSMSKFKLILPVSLRLVLLIVSISNFYFLSLF